MNKRLLMMSHSPTPPLDKEFHTKKIWREVAKGFEILVTLTRSTGMRFGKFKIGNIINISVMGYKNSLSFIPPSILLGPLICKTYDIDCIVTQDPMLSGFPGYLTSKFNKVPFMSEVHTDLFLKPKEIQTKSEMLLNRGFVWGLKKSHQIRVISPNYVPRLVELGIDRSKIVMIPNRVDLKIFKAPEKMNDGLKIKLKAKKYNIVSIGRYVPQKGYRHIIEAMKYIIRQKSDIKLFLVGDGALRPSFERLIQELNLKENICLTGWKDDINQIVEYLKIADIYIQPSIPFLGECFPRTILEAGAMKVPIISTNVGGIPGFLNDSNSVLLNSLNGKKIASEILNLLSDEMKRKELSDKMYELIKREFEWKKVFKNYINVVRRIDLS